MKILVILFSTFYIFQASALLGSKCPVTSEKAIYKGAKVANSVVKIFKFSVSRSCNELKAKLVHKFPKCHIRLVGAENISPEEPGMVHAACSFKYKLKKPSKANKRWYRRFVDGAVH